MSSDVMVICKEFKNSFDNLTADNNYKAEIPAVFIDEASMGEPWNEFGKWFVGKFYNGYSMLDIIMLSNHEGQKKVDELSNTIFDNPLSQFDCNVIISAVDIMECHVDLNKELFKSYIKSCVGKSISTENW